MMLNNKGWFKWHRKTVDGSLFFAEKWTRWQFWFFLVMQASTGPFEVWKNGTIQRIERGEIFFTYTEIEKLSKWKRGKINRYLNSLQKAGKITFIGTPNGTLITVCNYNDYQAFSDLENKNGTLTERSRNGDGTETERSRNEDGTETGLHNKKRRKEEKKKRKKEEVDTTTTSDLENQLLEIFEQKRSGYTSTKYDKEHIGLIPQAMTERAGQDLDDDTILNTWDAFLEYMPERYKAKKLWMICEDYDAIANSINGY